MRSYEATSGLCLPSTVKGKAAMGGQGYPDGGDRVAVATGLGLTARESLPEKVVCDSGNMVAGVS